MGTQKSPLTTCWVISFTILTRCLRYWSYFRRSDKRGYSLYIQFNKLLWFYVDFFSNLGFYYNDVEYRHKYHNRQRISIRKTSLLYSIYDDDTRRDLLLLLFTRPLPRDGGMAEDHGAPEAGKLPRVWTRGHKETESRQRVSGAKSP